MFYLIHVERMMIPPCLMIFVPSFNGEDESRNKATLDALQVSLLFPFGGSLGLVFNLKMF